MKDLARRIAGFLAELKRRKVYRVAAVYVIVAIGALELADVLVPATALPTWSEEFFVVLAIVGFPLVVVLAWVFDVTPEGVRKEAAPSPESPTSAGPVPDADRGEGAAGRDPGAVGSEVGTAVLETTGDEVLADAVSELDPRAIAVLPFANLSDAPDAEPFAAGLHDDLLTELSRASALTVISRTSVQRYGRSDRSIREIGRELGVGTIVEAAVQKVGDRVRLNVQLIDARSDRHLWAERYDHELSAASIFELQSELAARIMESLHATLTGREEADAGKGPTADLEAYRQYSIARALGVERSKEALESATAHLERALERDAEYALAWAELALVLVGLVDYRHLDSKEILERGGAAARRALELDPELAEAHAALGNYHFALRDCRRGLEAHGRAIALRPSYAGAHQWRCWGSLLIGDPAVALEAGKRASRLDPLDTEAAGNLACSHLACGEDAEALRIAQDAMDRHPDFDWPRWVAGLALHHLGREAEGDETLGTLKERWAHRWGPTAAGLARARAGDEEGAREVLDRHLVSGGIFHAALLHACLGDTPAAFGAIRDVLPLTWDEALFLRYYRGAPLDALRADARWAALERDLDRGWGA